MANQFKNLAEIAATLEQSEAKHDTDACKIAVLFPFVECLGYDATQTGDILLNPAYSADGEYKLDYGLRGKIDGSIQTVIKVIPYGEEPGLEFASIRSALSEVSHVDYVIITDNFNYYIYANSGDTFIDVTSFRLSEIGNDDIRLLKVLANPSVSTKQEFAIDERDDTAEDRYGLTPAPSVQESKNEKTKKAKPAMNVSVLPVIVAFFCCVILCVAAILGIMQRGDVSRWYSISFPHSAQTLDVHALKSDVDAYTYADKLDVIHVGLSDSNLCAGVNVRFTLRNKNTGKAVERYSLTDEAGTVSVDFELGKGWKDCYIDIIAELPFDSSQTQAAVQYYGTGGTKIVKIGSEDKFLVGKTTVYYDSTKISQTIAEKEAEEAAKDLIAKKQYFSQFTVVQYSNGDLCFYPKGYDTNDWPTKSDAANSNINVNDKAYAKIYFDVSTGDATFYFIVGTIMGQPNWAAGEYVLSAGSQSYSFPTKNGEFYYHVNQYTNILGWSVFKEDGVAELRKILAFVYNSSDAKIEFKGLNEKRSITEKDKKAVTSILDLYNTFFDSENIVLNPQWWN